MRRVAKGFHLAVLVLAVGLLAAACSAAGSSENGEKGTDGRTWQDYYDLGVRYLSEGNYEEAIIAFTAAIEIDPSRPEAYVGRGDAYRGKGDTAADLAAALSDYLKAVECGDTDKDTQRKIKEIYIAQGDTESAIDLLLETEDITPGSVAEQQLFDLLDLYTGDGSTIDVSKYLFTDKIVRPSEWTINGTPIWKAGTDNIRAIVGDAGFEANNGPYKDENDIADYGGYATTGGDRFMVEKESQIFCIGDYRTIGTECRGIRPGMSARECLSLLGLTDIGIEYLIYQMGQDMEVGDSLQGYGYNFAILGDPDVNEVWWFYPRKRYIVDGLQWYLQYSFNEEGAEDRTMISITFLCDENENISEIRYRNAVNGHTWG